MESARVLIRQTEQPQKQRIHGRRDKHETNIKLVQCPVFIQTIGDEAVADEVEEVEVQGKVDNEEETLFDVLEDKVEVLLELRCRVEMRGDPDGTHCDVYESDGDKKGPAELQGFPPAHHDQSNSVGDDL
jgi:hypothetical protein